MTTGVFDGALGVAVVMALALLLHEAGGAAGVAWGVGLFAARALGLFLWESASRTARVMAILLVPAVLLTYLMPRELRRAIRRLERSTARQGV